MSSFYYVAASMRVRQRSLSPVVQDRRGGPLKDRAGCTSCHAVDEAFSQ